MRKFFRFTHALTLVLIAIACLPAPAQTRPPDISFVQLIQPAELVKLLQSSATKPLVIQVGSHVLYTEAHIPGSEYIGPASSDEGLQKLRNRVKALPKNSPIVLYCGCCPWSHCPNVKPAYAELHGLGFTNVKVLQIPDNFGADWVEKGYPVTTGE